MVPFDGGVAHVFGGDFIIHLNAQGVHALTGRIAANVNVQLPPTVSRASAASAAVRHARGRVPEFLDADLGELQLLVLARSSGDEVAWCSESTLTGDAYPTPQVLRLCTSGHGAGGLLVASDMLRTGTATQGMGYSFFNGNVTINSDYVTGMYYLRDPTRGTNGGGYTTNLAGATSGTGTIYSGSDANW